MTPCSKITLENSINMQPCGLNPRPVYISRRMLKRRFKPVFARSSLTCRQKKIKACNSLQRSDLEKWTYFATPKSEGVEYDGMPWSHVQIFDIFEILAQVCEASYMDDTYGAQIRWFDHDKAALKAERLHMDKFSGNPYVSCPKWLTVVPNLHSHHCSLNCLQ